MSRKSKNAKKQENKKQSKLALKEWQEKRGIEDFAQNLKNDMPKSEEWFLSLFIKEHVGIYLENNKIIGYYIADFVYKKIIFEIDDPTHEKDVQKEKDIKKDRYYRSQGYKVIRIKAWDRTSFNEGMKRFFSYLNQERERIINNNKIRELQGKKLKNTGKIIRTRELTDYEKRRQDYIKKKKSMK